MSVVPIDGVNESNSIVRFELPGGCGSVCDPWWPPNKLLKTFNFLHWPQEFGRNFNAGKYN